MLVALSDSVILLPVAPFVEFIATAFPSASLHTIDLASSLRAVNSILSTESA